MASKASPRPNTIVVGTPATRGRATGLRSPATMVIVVGPIDPACGPKSTEQRMAKTGKMESFLTPMLYDLSYPS
jgi:hypothetical protein